MNGNPKYPAGYGVRKRRSQKVAFAVFRILSLFITVILFAILGFIIVKGAGALSWDFLTKAPEDGMTSGGIFPAIVGTLLDIGFGTRRPEDITAVFDGAQAASAPCDPKGMYLQEVRYE